MRQQTSSETSLGVGALQAVERYRRASLSAAAQIYLKDIPCWRNHSARAH